MTEATQALFPVDEYLIRKGRAYYRPNAAGYTYNVEEAGRYSLEDAIRHSHPNGPDGPRDGIDYMPAPARQSHSLPGEALVKAATAALKCLELSVQSFPDVERELRAALTPSPCPGEPMLVRDDQCNVEFGTVPDCDCPHEHWHVAGICLDVHIEEDRTGHAILGNDDWQLEVSGVENLDEMRAIAIAWAKQKYALTPSALSGDAGGSND